MHTNYHQSFLKGINHQQNCSCPQNFREYWISLGGSGLPRAKAVTGKKTNIQKPVRLGAIKMHEVTCVVAPIIGYGRLCF